MARNALRLLAISLDDSDVAEVSVACRSKWPRFELKKANTIAGIKRVINGKSPNVILLDLNSNDNIGLNMLKQIRSYSQAPVIVLSYTTNIEKTLKTIEAGANYLMIKPIRKNELLVYIEHLINQHQSTKQSSNWGINDD